MTLKLQPIWRSMSSRQRRLLQRLTVAVYRLSFPACVCTPVSLGSHLYCCRLPTNSWQLLADFKIKIFLNTVKASPPREPEQEASFTGSGNISPLRLSSGFPRTGIQAACEDSPTPREGYVRPVPGLLAGSRLAWQRQLSSAIGSELMHVLTVIHWNRRRTSKPSVDQIRDAKGYHKATPTCAPSAGWLYWVPTSQRAIAAMLGGFASGGKSRRQLAGSRLPRQLLVLSARCLEPSMLTSHCALQARQADLVGVIAQFFNFEAGRSFSVQ